ncbi:SpoIIE family protein phosphatase [Streptosporangiaceae bacterium NEAU-GS5]|nr:SpoIIE family protein phosphatase [Streptosporangiaceae bacterium NEAU-GS5]
MSDPSDERGGDRRQKSGVQREHKLLRQVFRALPVPVVIIDASGVVRRINNETARLLGSPSGYLVGRAFPMLVETSRRAAFRAELSAAIRREESDDLPVSFETRLVHQGRTHTVQMTLNRLRLPGEPQEMLAGVLMPAQADAPAVPAGPRSHAGDVDEAMILEVARRHELLSQVTRLLLEEESLSEPVALLRVARLLAVEMADWVIADVLRERTAHRSAVIGPSDQPVAPLHRALESADPSAAPVVVHVLETRAGVVHEMLTDDGLLGEGVLQSLGAGSLLSVPIGVDPDITGVLSLVRLRDRAPFSLADLGLLEEIGAHLGLAMRAQRNFQRRSQAADTLQTGVLPRHLPEIPGFETAAIYHRGTGLRAIGGEFYDVFPLDRGWGFVIGSAAGRGDEAAAVTAMVRNGLRVLSTYEKDPGEALRKVNDALVAQHTGMFVMAAAGFVRGKKVRLASAGHHPAALLQPDGAVRYSGGGGIPLGFEEGAMPASEEIPLALGDTLLLYSDGLVGARSPGGEIFGEDRLSEVLARCVGQSPGAVVKAVEEDHRAFCGDHAVDEMTVLAVRRVR